MCSSLSYVKNEKMPIENNATDNHLTLHVSFFHSDQFNCPVKAGQS